MARPLKINTSTSPVSLKEMDDNEMRGISYKILQEFAGNDTTTGMLGIGSTPAGATSIGSFVDTSRTQGPGTHPAGTSVTTIISNFYQRTAVLSESGTTLPIDFDSGVGGIQEQSNTELNEHIMRRTLTMMTSTADNEGMGQYRLQPNSPTGGTWGQMAVMQDRIKTASSISTNNTVLWKRQTQATAYSIVRPLKVLDGGAGDDSLKEMTDTEVKALVTKYRNRIISSGIGTYKVQQNAPAGGTWVRSGLAFDDDIRQRTNQNYTGSYSGTYSGTRTYSGNYAGAYTGTYSGGTFAGSYVRYTPAYYGGRYGGNVFGGSFTGYYTGYFTGSYTGYYSGSRTYSANYTGSYSGTYTGATIQTATQVASQVSLWMRTA